MRVCGEGGVRGKDEAKDKRQDAMDLGGGGLEEVTEER